MNRRSAWVVLGLSVTALLATPVAVVATRPRMDAGSLDAVIGRWDLPGKEVQPTFGSSEVLIPGLGVHPSRLEDLKDPEQGPRPSRVVIHAIGVDAPIVPVGVAPSNTMQIPADISIVGWYRFGPSPGEPGSAILAGHVDSRVQGRGVFFFLRQLAPGDSLVIRYSDGGSKVFRVVARRSYAKNHLPSMLFRRSGGPVLTLLTCGGSFDRIRRQYADNVAVFAVPATR
jgi:hypothetical protein